MKKFISLLLVIVIVGSVFVLPTSAASYPLVFMDFADSSVTNVIPYGEVGTLLFNVLREFNNEKLHIEIYDSDGYITAETTCSYGSSGSSIVEQTITVDTEKLEMTPGKYTVKYWMEFYSMYEWHTAPNSYTHTIEVIKNVCNGKHNMVFKETFTEADCESDGLDIYKCTNCEYYRYRDVKGSHSFGEWEVLDETKHQCVCEVCFETKTENHTWDAGKITVKPTDTTSGTKVYKCTKCGTSFKETIYKCENGMHVYSNKCDTECNNCGDIRKVGNHIPGNWIIDKKATVNATGKKHKECTECGKILETAVIPQLKPATPKLTAIANTASGVKVTWGKVAGATGYIVYRKSGDGKWTNLGKTTGTSFGDKTAKAGVTYKYTIKAYYGSYVSAYNTNGYAVRRLTIPTLKSAVSSKTGITFTWNKVTGATGYIVYRKTGSGSWQRLGTVKTNTYLDKTAKKGVTYKYTVKAYYGTSTSYYNTKGLTIKDKY